jgi:uroporphyrinogen decarboxylase
MLQNDLLLRAAQGLEVERPPVWIMRQAGRILSEYRATRAQAGSFIQLVKNPKLAAEVTIQPVDILGVDAAIIFSDILVIPEAMGLPYVMDEGKGPQFPKTIVTMEDVHQLQTENVPAHLQYVTDAIGETLHRLQNRVPLIGFAGAPWTLFCYMIEGKGSKEFSKARRFLIEQPELSQALLTKITDATLHYMDVQIAAGIHLFQLFDSWAGVLNEAWYTELILPHVHRIFNHMNGRIPSTFFPKGGHYFLGHLQALKCETIGLDWQVKPQVARTALPNKTLQGNMDPAFLYGSDTLIKNEAQRLVGEFGKQRYIANLGHGVYPDMDYKKLKLFIETIQKS